MNKTAFKIAISIISVTIFSLLVVNTITAYQAERAFDTFLQGQEQFGFRVIPNVREIQTQLRLESEFRDRLYEAIVLVSGIAVIISAIVGVSVARFITRPLRLLKEGLSDLRSNKSQNHIASTGNEEVDDVIIEFNKLSDELAFQESLRTNLIADISHEFKTPLTSLTGQIHGIKDGVFKPTKQRLEIIDDQLSRLTDLVNNLQNYTHMQSELRQLNKKSFQLEPFLKKFCATYDEQLQKENISLSFKNIKKVSLNADKAKFTRLLDNIVGNTIKYANASKITISVDKNEKTLSVKDNGVGVAEKDVPYLFERFYRVEKSRNRKTGGLGLGLAIVKDIADAHGWETTITSGDKTGLTFTFQMTQSMIIFDESIESQSVSKRRRFLTRLRSSK